MRRISTGQVGDTVLGTLVTEDNSVRPLAGSDTLTLNGNTVAADTNFEITGGNSLRVYNGSNYVDVNAPSIGSNVNFTLPANTGTSGQVIQTNGSGVLEFVDTNIPVSNETADTSTYYPLISTSTSGSITSVRTSSSKLSYTPNTGTLSATTFTGNFEGDLTGNVTGNVDGNVDGNVTSTNVDITGGSINNTAIGGSNRSTGDFSAVSATNTSTFRDINPETDGSYDLGTSSSRWRNIFTNDLNLSNMSSDGNSVDNTTGDWTIQEGSEELFLINNLSNKKYKFVLEEIR